MRLIAATNDFVIGGRPYPGFPILLWDDMHSCGEVNQFFRYYLLRGAIGSSKSWASTGRAMYDYFSFLQAHELVWSDGAAGGARSFIAAYRDYCFKAAGLARSTVRNRLLYVCEFYAFAHRQGWVAELPFGYEGRIRQGHHGFLRHVQPTGRMQVRDAMPRLHKAALKFLTRDEVQALLAAATNPHHRMLIRLALGTGLRKEELATFPRAYVFDPDLAGRPGRNLRVSLDPRDGHGMKTKGDKPRDIYIDRSLMKDMNHYAVHVRGLRASLASHRCEPLLLNQSGEPFSADGKSLDRIVRLIGRRAGLRVWPHLLRHTYATHTLVALQRHRDRNRIEPVVFVQRQLGHASIQTTMIYLHVVNELADDAVLAYDAELDQEAAGR
jgi:integrase/recombinase XerD